MVTCSFLTSQLYCLSHLGYAYQKERLDSTDRSPTLGMFFIEYHVQWCVCLCLRVYVCVCVCVCSGCRNFCTLALTDRTSLVAQVVKHLPPMRETWARSLGQEDPLVKEMATHSSTLAWRIPWTVEPGRLQSMRLQRAGQD